MCSDVYTTSRAHVKPNAPARDPPNNIKRTPPAALRVLAKTKLIVCMFDASKIITETWLDIYIGIRNHMCKLSSCCYPNVEVAATKT